MSSNVTATIQEFFSQYRLRKFSKGQVLILEGDTTANVFFIRSGKVKMYDVSYRGEEIILNVFKTPAFFPMSLALNKTETPYIYEAETDIEVHIAPANEVVEFLRKNPEVMLDLLSRLYRGMDGLLGRMSHLMSGSAKSRLLYELILEARRFGEKTGDKSVRLDINEKDLGARTGLARETVSREIHKLKEVNLISISSAGITLPDVAALQKALSLIV